MTIVKDIYSLQTLSKKRRFYSRCRHHLNNLLQSISGSSNAVEKVIHGEELSFNDGLELLNNENVFVLGAAANLVKKKLTGNVITFVASYYLNYTNVCAASCPLCAFYRKADEPD